MPFLREKSGRWSPEKIIAFVGVCLPALWLAYRTSAGDLGARPVTELIHRSGDWAVRILLVTLAITPARRLFHFPKLIQARRTLGVAAAFYIFAHFTLYVIDQKFDVRTVASEIVLRFYLTIGFLGLIGLIALAVTSTDAMIRSLGHNWGKLHRLAYFVGVIAVVHFALQKKLDIYEPLLMTGFLFWLLAFRAVQRYAREVTFPWLLALAAFATLFTALYEALWYGVLTGVDARRILAINLNVSDFSMLRPAVWVLIVTLAVALAFALNKWLRPREPARVRLNPAE
ncbi:MAG TPA: protein-methionine-sulfoxide reductase heme-binding subunit MsrQ [Xanthobacteraceae bacterium]|jgi:sulfoxide reductase heme-binding subunit YedZ